MEDKIWNCGNEICDTYLQNAIIDCGKLLNMTKWIPMYIYNHNRYTSGRSVFSE